MHLNRAWLQGCRKVHDLPHKWQRQQLQHTAATHARVKRQQQVLPAVCRRGLRRGA
jgi:hypothetical protein